MDDLVSVAAGAAALWLSGEEPVLGALRNVLPAEVRTWRTGEGVDGEQVMCLVDVIRQRARGDPALITELTVLATGPEADEALRGLGEACDNREQWATAAWCHRRRQDILRWLGDGSGLARSFMELGAVHERRGRTADAARWYQRGGAAYEELGERLSSAEALIELGRVHHRNGRGPEALACLDQAVTRLLALGDEHRALRALSTRVAVAHDEVVRRGAVIQPDSRSAVAT
jgi:hypothetical protein